MEGIGESDIIAIPAGCDGRHHVNARRPAQNPLLHCDATEIIAHDQEAPNAVIDAPKHGTPECWQFDYARDSAWHAFCYGKVAHTRMKFPNNSSN
jgi:hypothetical protein